MYRRILKTEKWRWYREDILLPMLSATAMAVLLVEVVPVSGSPVYQFSAIAMSGLLILAAAIFGAPKVAEKFGKWFMVADRYARRDAAVTLEVDVCCGLTSSGVTLLILPGYKI